MPDSRKHRGPHPEDQRLFADQQIDKLRDAVADLSWLLTRSYAADSALKLVGDRYQLEARQRNAVRRSSCSDLQLASRKEKQIDLNVQGIDCLLIDGFNVLTTVEAALSGAVVLCCRDGCFRDIASMHGSFRKVEETLPAIQLIGQTLAKLQVARCVWYFDRPVSNSGRIRDVVKRAADENGWEWLAELEMNPDQVLCAANQPIASSDSAILDRCDKWLNLARICVESSVGSAWVLSLA